MPVDLDDSRVKLARAVARGRANLSKVGPSNHKVRGVESALAQNTLQIITPQGVFGFGLMQEVDSKRDPGVLLGCSHAADAITQAIEKQLQIQVTEIAEA